MRRRRTGSIAAAALAAFLVALAASCAPPGEPARVVVPPPAPASPEPPPSAPPSASAAAPPDAKLADAGAPHEPAAAAWEDDEVVQALAKDCHWDPDGCLGALVVAAERSVDQISFASEGAPSRGPENPPAVCQPLLPLACAQVPGQSCAPDECGQGGYTCVPACDQACGTCASRCVKGCDACKSACKDDACRLACARSCAGCRAGCVKELDHCASARCNEEEETCFRTRDDAWNRSECPKVCPKVQACVEKCPEIPDDYTGERYVAACAVKCLKQLGRGCPKRFDRICMGDPNASANFNAFHEARNSGAR